MKRPVLCLILAFALLLAACHSPAGPTGGTSYLLYFPADGEHRVQGTLRSVDSGLSPESTGPEQLLEHYLAAAAPSGALSLLPQGWFLASRELSGSTLTLSFRGPVADELQNSLLAACLTQTLFQSEQLQRLNLQLPGRSTLLSLTREDVLLSDTGMLPPQAEVILYLPDDEHRYLLRETRTVPPMDIEETCRYVVQQLLDFDDRNRSCIPPLTRLLDLSVENGVCTVDLSSAFVLTMEQSFRTERMAVYSIVNSLTELPEISTVDLWVSGAPLERLYLMDLSSGVVRDERLIAASGQMFDATVCLVCDDRLVQLPLQLSLPEDGQPAEQLLQQLLSYQGSNGLRSPIPGGTKLLSLKLDSGLCMLDLTAEFRFQDPQEELLAVRSIVLTLCSLPQISAVELLVEGIAPSFLNPGLTGVLSADESWLTQ